MTSRRRILASLVLGTAVALGATGCNMIAPQATTISYAPAEGVNFGTAAGPVEARNVFIVANEKGTAGNLVGAFANPTKTAKSATVQVGGRSSSKVLVPVPAGDAVSLGSAAIRAVEIPGFSGKPGTVVDVFIQSGDGVGQTLQVPVLDGKMDYLKPLAPRS